MEMAANLIVVGLALSVFVDLVFRWRSATGEERLQMHWFGLGGA